MTTPHAPTKYLGPNQFLGVVVSRNRIPSLADYIQPETGKYYPIGCVWQVGKNPTSGTEGDLYMLSKIVANQGYWILFSSGAGSIDSVQVDASTPSGTNPVLATSGGLITVNGGQIAAGSTANVIRTNSLAANTYTIEVQRSSAQASSTIGANGVSHFSSTDFAVDSNGFVTQNTALPAFYIGTNQIDNVTGDGTSYVILFSTPVFDLGSNYNPATGLFTAPYNGIYQFATYVSLLNVDAAMTRGIVLINAAPITDNSFATARNVANTVGYNGSVILSLNAGATVSVSVQVDNSTKTCDINANSFFCGALIRRT